VKLKTKRVMVKDEDVCLHCGLCAERCPTGAWDMQKFLLDITHAGDGCRTRQFEKRRPHEEDRGGQRFRGEVRQTSMAPARLRPTSSSPRASCAWASRSARATSSPPTSQGLRPWYEVRVTEKGHLGRRGGVDLMVAMNPQTWTQDVKEMTRAAISLPMVGERHADDR